MGFEDLPIYKENGDVLGMCIHCWAFAYVEPHGVTVHCDVCEKETKHDNIPQQFRIDGFGGDYVEVLKLREVFPVKFGGE